MNDYCSAILNRVESDTEVPNGFEAHSLGSGYNS